MPNVRKIRRRKRFHRHLRKRKALRAAHQPCTLTGVRSIELLCSNSSIYAATFSDMYFTQLCFTKDPVVSLSPTSNSGGSILHYTNVQVYGYSGIAFPSYASLIARSPSVTRIPNAGPNLRIKTPYIDAKLTSLSFTIRPSTPASKRSGMWSAVFLPFRNYTDIDTMPTGFDFPDCRRIQCLPGSVTNTCDRPLRLSFSPSVEDGYIFSYNKMNMPMGALLLAYVDESRVHQGSIPTEDFAPSIIMRGRVKLRLPKIGANEEFWDQFPRLNHYPTMSVTATTGVDITYSQEVYNNRYVIPIIYENGDFNPDGSYKKVVGQYIRGKLVV